ncbi:MAG: FecR domain-containing protein [Verrucomicrobia bacterium]|nr:FecR domain-containing protein [Verrucomicrobiota bacterium]
MFSSLARGKAHFTVAKNPSRPFVVSAGGGDVQAVGTVFNIRLRSEAIEVFVTEGKVQVDSERGDRKAERGPEAPGPPAARVFPDFKPRCPALGKQTPGAHRRGKTGRPL